MSASDPTTPASHNLAFIESQYARYLDDPSQLSEDWREYFASFADNGVDTTAVRHALDAPHFPTRSIFDPAASATPAEVAPRASTGTDDGSLIKVIQLIHQYRVRGHLLADLDPLGIQRPAYHPELDPKYYGFTEADYDRVFEHNTIAGGAKPMTLREILERVETVYSREIAVQFMHIDSLPCKKWLIKHLEDPHYQRSLSPAEQRRVLGRLTDAEVFEDFLGKKYLGAKRFSLEGSETLMPLLDLALEDAGAHGVEEVVVAMAHRGRLNVMVNLLGKSPSDLFHLFEDDHPHLHEGRGDVKYHLGHSNDFVTSQGHKMHLSLCFNPSHLEFVNPVALGRVRAKQNRLEDYDRRKVLGILIHGDAAIAGQGVTQELLNMSGLPGYLTGGTLHIVVNNQIGFTTPPELGRSTRYATEIGRMLQTPIFHVNGENPEAVARVVRLAMDYRNEFNQDVFIDMYCYRKFGHNESDEPAYTQPLMYEVIRKRKTVREGYLDHLLALGDVTKDEADKLAEERRADLQSHLDHARSDHELETSSGEGLWGTYRGGRDADTPQVETGVERETLQRVGRQALEIPEKFNIHRKLKRLLKQRREMVAGERPFDWATAELTAFATLLAEGSPIRFTGQDSPRGTFSHRHAAFTDVEIGHPLIPLTKVAETYGTRFTIHESPLSEVAVLGFEYGFSLDTPEGLTIWEAQFGDFVNVAQVIIDQFIASSEDKWARLSSVVMLLPHGFEGQGPEHSSARLERFLTLAAEDNIQVVNVTTPAQYFHCLRRQVRRPIRKPLVVMSPKSLLRHPRVVSPLDDLTHGGFQRVIGDDSELASVRKVILTSGKVYWDLIEAREERGIDDVAIVRLEQYYPYDLEEIDRAVSQWGELPVTWVQEEPRNMGAWSFIRTAFDDEMQDRWRLSCVCRKPSASPATGSLAAHRQEQSRLIEKALA
ncbi:MAG: 2-oxoglutarate dehydrogenase E1 component [Acidobacteriota bacterium]